jgi:hypothetical protein
LRERLRRDHLLAARVVALRIARVAGADDEVFHRAVGDAEAGREEVLLHFDPAVVLVRSDAADEQAVCREVVHFDAVIGAPRQ